MARDCSKGMLEYFGDSWVDGEAFAKKIRLFASRQGITVAHALWAVAHFGATHIDPDGKMDHGSSFDIYFDSHMGAFKKCMERGGE